MRRLLPILLAIATALSAAQAGEAVARGHHDRGEEQRGEGRGWGGGRDRGGPPPWAQGRPEGRGEGRGGGRWEQRHAAPPPEAYGPPPVEYQPRRGGYLPPEARGGLVQDYGRYRLRRPPPGYGWVRSGRALMLMDMNTGQVFDVIPD